MPQYQIFTVFAGVNNAGNVAGGINDQAAIFSPTQGTLLLPAAPNASISAAFAINNVGQAAGRAVFPGIGPEGVVWSGNSVQNIGMFVGNPNSVANGSYAYGLNDLGQAVGYSWAGSYAHAHLWSAGSGLVDLGTIGGGMYSAALAINNAGQAVGYAGIANSQAHAALWANGVGYDLGTLGGDASRAYAINSSGQVAGTAATAGNASERAFLWSGNNMLDLGTFGGNSSDAYGVSDAGQVVGGAFDVNNVYMAAIWQETNGVHQIYDLASLVNDGVTNSGWTFESAHGISANGQWVVARGQNAQTGYSDWVLLEANALPVTATPEPATMTLMATGLAGMAAWKRRRQKTAT